MNAVKSVRLVLLAALLLAALVVAAPGAARTHPRVWLAGAAAVRGSGFPAGKVHVTVRVADDQHAEVRVVRASKRGRFTARFAGSIAPSGCRATVVTAVGRRGVTAVRRFPATAQDCAQPIQPLTTPLGG